jgi:hypothetical protein
MFYLITFQLIMQSTTTKKRTRKTTIDVFENIDEIDRKRLDSLNHRIQRTENKIKILRLEGKQYSTNMIGNAISKRRGVFIPEIDGDTVILKKFCEEIGKEESDIQDVLKKMTPDYTAEIFQMKVCIGKKMHRLRTGVNKKNCRDILRLEFLQDFKLIQKFMLLTVNEFRKMRALERNVEKVQKQSTAKPKNSELLVVLQKIIDTSKKTELILDVDIAEMQYVVAKRKLAITNL